MLPYEILQLVDREFATSHYTIACSKEFITELRAFIHDEIVQPAARYRAAYGMPAGLQPLRKGTNPLGKATRTLSLVFSGPVARLTDALPSPHS